MAVMIIGALIVAFVLVRFYGDPITRGLKRLLALDEGSENKEQNKEEEGKKVE